MIIPKLEIRGWYMKDRKTLPVWYVEEQLPQILTRRKTRKSVNSSKYMQTNLMLLMMPMLMMKMMIIYPRKKGLRFVLSHSKFRYLLAFMFLALVICLCIYSLHYEFKILFLYLLFSIP